MKKDLDNWWTYHKGLVYIGIIVLILICMTVSSLKHKNKTEILDGIMINQPLEQAKVQEWEDKMMKLLGGDEKKEKVFLDASLKMDLEAEDSDTQAALAKVTAYVYDGELDFMILDQKTADHYSDLKAYVPLKELLSEKLYNSLKTRFYNKNGEDYGISLEGTAFVTDNHIQLSHPVICILKNSKHKANAVRLINELFAD